MIYIRTHWTLSKTSEEYFDFSVHVQFKHTLAFTLTLIDVRNVLIKCDDVLKLHMHRFLLFSH
jgi:hypothetical protein